MTKRRIALFMAGLAVSALVGCSSDADTSSTPGPSVSSTYATSPTGAFAAARERFDGAYDFCIEQVKERLKAPATAHFSPRDRDHEAQDGDRYLFTGTVDSENGFGALLRSDFGCQIRWTGSDYETVSVTID